MTIDELVQSACISIGKYDQLTRRRIKIKIPGSVTHIISKYQWEFLVRYKEFNLTANRNWSRLPSLFDKEIALWHDDLDKPMRYVTPYEYVEKRALDSNPYGQEAVIYTISGHENIEQRRIWVLDPPTSAKTIKMFYSIKFDSTAVHSLPDEFIPVIESHIIYRITPPTLIVKGIEHHNPSFVTARGDYRSNLTELVQREEGQRGRFLEAKLSEVDSEAYEDYHK